ncbi:FMN-binding protein [Paenibacillus sp. FSL H7-0331]|uniref:FMN-binding protein n=1 Tax=Paenibacillus sp. FSL H7-0331 TaxID=1920421 RepID=UPI00096D89C1|nr:FMN-binding protein [Paenibacillus sp. FSL H7-0331]OMF20126.1 hypothetical protein BK127_04365 [Paenibacillus sp. FSL H7-0331]
MAIIGKKLIALCSTAIGIVYAAGYVVTEPQSLQAMHPTESVMTSATSSSSSEQVRPIDRPQRHSSSNSNSSPKPSTPTAVQPSGTNAKYKDGSYTGSGTNRFGTVEVAVTIQKGSIANVEITRSATRYPVTYIESLPQQVIDKQSANIDTVSRATNSSKDFIEAVQQALNKAQQLS